MRKWLKTLKTPVVPDDAALRQEALCAATQNVESVLQRQDLVHEVTESIRQHGARNHFIERLELSYGINRR